MEQGYIQATMQDIYDACGLSKGGLYRHYKDKRQLFTELLETRQGGGSRSGTGGNETSGGGPGQF